MTYMIIQKKCNDLAGEVGHSFVRITDLEGVVWRFVLNL